MGKVRLSKRTLPICHLTNFCKLQYIQFTVHGFINCRVSDLCNQYHGTYVKCTRAICEVKM